MQPSVFQQVLGAAFFRLPDSLRQLHSSRGLVRYTGRATVERGRNPLARLCAWLAGLPPAVVVVGECDPLYDQGRRYAALLAEAGVPVTEIVCTGHGHGSMFFTGMLESARTHVADMVTAIHTARAR